jgi:chemotaxis protein MotB
MKPLYTWNNPILQARNRRVEIYIEVATPKEEKEKKVELKREEKLPPEKASLGKR